MHPSVRVRRAGARVPVSAVRAAKAQGARKGGTGLRTTGAGLMPAPSGSACSGLCKPCAIPPFHTPSA